MDPTYIYIYVYIYMYTLAILHNNIRSFFFFNRSNMAATPFW